MNKDINLRETTEYREYGFQIVKCPVCDNETLDNHFICHHCGWEYDGRTQDDEYSTSNGMTLKEYKDHYLNK